ncbi:hypothetical protein J4E83_003709 [Alternaria metachromatica]|uniref:uncharacterized protein n=1 Tax=Alternaria metachromatica TaxID=283354 RepID=UPI0020C4DDD1|nr:uncharacterized protein J4E83_003709 [Alternaria metachromatica]KAI4626558.1 hypothetical protein J4E83_003709 [Alternaria metachromatica]
MFEDTMEDLEQTKDKLEAAENELEKTQTRPQSQLDKAEHDANFWYRGWKNMDNSYQAADSTLKAHEHQIHQLEAELALEKERAEKNENAQKMLEQLKNQWSFFSHILGNEDSGR